MYLIAFVIARSHASGGNVCWPHIVRKKLMAKTHIRNSLFFIVVFWLIDVSAFFVEEEFNRTA